MEVLQSDEIDIDFNLIPGFSDLSLGLSYDCHNCSKFDPKSDLWFTLDYFSLCNSFLSHILSVYYVKLNYILYKMGERNEDTVYVDVAFFQNVYSQFFCCGHLIQYYIPLQALILRHSIHGRMIIRQINNLFNSERVHKTTLGLIYISVFWHHFDKNIQVKTVKLLEKHYKFLSNHYNPLVQDLFFSFMKRISLDEDNEALTVPVF